MPPVARIRPPLALLPLLLLAACAPLPRGPAAAPGEREEEEEPGDVGAHPVAPEDAEARIADLRARLAAAGPEEAPALRLRVAGLLERSARADAALVEYLGLTGATKPEVAAAAWDAVARILRRGGDEEEAVRAEAEAVRASPADERAAREASLAASMSRLDAGALRALERRIRGPAAGELVAREIASRGVGSEVVVAMLLPLSGRFENFGRAFRLGAEIAVADRRARRTGGPPVRVLVEDTAGELPTASRAARSVIVEGGAVAILGPLLSLPALAAGALADAFGVPLIAPTATDPAVRRIGRHVLPLDPPPSEITEPLAELAIATLGARRFGALVPREPAAEERERAFRAAVERRGGAVVLSVAYDPGERDFRKLLEMLEDARPDAVYVPAEPADLEALVPQLDFYEFAPRLLGHGGWTSPRVFRPGVTSLDGTLLAVESADDPDSRFARHMREAVQRHENAEPTRFHVQGYRAMAAVLYAVDHGAVAPEAIGEMLRLRTAWPERPEGEEIRLLTIKGGVLVPATPANLSALSPRTAGGPSG